MICFDIFHLFRQDKNAASVENLQRKIAFFGELTATADEIGETEIQVFLKLQVLFLSYSRVWHLQ